MCGEVTLSWDAPLKDGDEARADEWAVYYRTHPDGPKPGPLRAAAGGIRTRLYAVTKLPPKTPVAFYLRASRDGTWSRLGAASATNTSDSAEVRMRATALLALCRPPAPPELTRASCAAALRPLCCQHRPAVPAVPSRSAVSPVL